jgi:hypothetical protein
MGKETEKESEEENQIMKKNTASIQTINNNWTLAKVCKTGPGMRLLPTISRLTKTRGQVAPTMLVNEEKGRT